MKAYWTKQFEALIGKHFAYNGAKFYYQDVHDDREKKIATIQTNNGLIPLEYKDFHNFFNKIEVLVEKKSTAVARSSEAANMDISAQELTQFIPPEMVALFQKHNEGAQKITTVLENIAEELGAKGGLTADKIQRAQSAAQISQAHTSQAKLMWQMLTDAIKLKKEFDREQKAKEKREKKDEPAQGTEGEQL